jgi:hypothetical protein
MKKLNDPNYLIKENFIYSSRFIVVNKQTFKIYRSKECFLRLRKPQLDIAINCIKESNFVLFNDKKANKNSHFYLKYVKSLNLKEIESKK